MKTIRYKVSIQIIFKINNLLNIIIKINRYGGLFWRYSIKDWLVTFQFIFVTTSKNLEE